MNEFGKFLCSLRKNKNMTQSELAKTLGVTNKAVSKWETGESMPDTSLLLPLSQLFGVSVDELLKGEKNEDALSKNEKISNHYEKNDYDEIKKHLFTRGKDDEKNGTLIDKVCGAVCASVFMLGVLIFVLIGTICNLWTPYWVIIPACALSCGIIGIIFDFCNAKKREKKIEKGENPFIGGICGLIMLSSIISYLLVGVVTSFWHPCWIILVVGVVACALTGSIGSVLSFKKKNEDVEQ